MSASNSETTVIITTYNDSVSDLTCALKSAITQSLPPKQIIVVDDGSSNDTAELVVEKEMATSSVALMLLKKQNGGPSSARNYGLKNCSTKYVTFLDSDDEMLNNNIEVKESCLARLADDYFGVYGTYIKRPGGLHEYMQHDGLIDTDLVGKDEGIPGGAPTYLFCTEPLLQVGGFDESLVFNEDFDLIIRLAKQGRKTKGSLGAGFIRNYREGSVTRNTRYFESYNSVGRFLAKADAHDYFSPHELAERRAANEHGLGSQLLRTRGFRLQGLSHLNAAYELSKRSGIKRFCSSLFVRVILRLTGTSQSDM